MQETKRVERQFASGSVLNDLFIIRYPYCPESEKVNQRFLEMLGTRELINVSKKSRRNIWPSKTRSIPTFCTTPWKAYEVRR